MLFCSEKFQSSSQTVTLKIIQTPYTKCYECYSMLFLSVPNFFKYNFTRKCFEGLTQYKTYGRGLGFLRKDIAQYLRRHKSREKLLMYQKCPTNNFKTKNYCLFKIFRSYLEKNTQEKQNLMKHGVD